MTLQPCGLPKVSNSFHASYQRLSSVSRMLEPNLLSDEAPSNNAIVYDERNAEHVYDERTMSLSDERIAEQP